MLNRRRFLLSLIAAAGIAAGAWSLRRGAVSPRARPHDERSSAGLAGAEIMTLVALARVLFPVDGIPESEAAVFFPDSIRIASAGIEPAFRSAARLLDESARQIRGAEAGFAALDPAAQEEILHSLIGDSRGDTVIERKFDSFMLSAQVLEFQNVVVRNTIRICYRSFYAWSMLGYIHAPGRPSADRLHYTKPVES